MAQDPAFSQFYANSLYLNPAFAGANINSRFSLNYRNQWSGIENGFVTFSGSYDFSMSKINSGFGIQFLNDEAGKALSSTSAGAIYSYHVKLNRVYNLRAGIQASYFQRTLNTKDLVFADQLSAWNGVVGETQEEWKNIPTARGLDISTGFLFYGKGVYAGLSVHHLTEPKNNSSTNSRLERKFTLHGGLCPRKKSKSGVTLSPHFLYQQQGSFRQLNIGLYAGTQALSFGLWLRKKDALILLIGFEHNRCKMGYSYDITYSKLITSNTRGSHEISFSYTIPNKQSFRKIKEVNCPVF